MKTNILNQLQDIVGTKNISIQKEHLLAHAKDKSFHDAHMPDVVIWPKTTQQISEIIKIAYANEIPVTPWGGGSSLQGNSIPMHGGIVVDMKYMKDIKEISKEGLYVVIQPGIICDELNSTLMRENIFFPATIGSSHIATLGGMVASNSGGMYAVKYGVIKDWVLELTVVRPNGEVMRVGSKSRKSVSGYNLLSLFVGSFGTLGIITQITLRVVPVPKSRMAALIGFKNIDDASSVLLKVLHSHIDPAAIELLDKEYAMLVNSAQKDITLGETDVLAIELHGEKEELHRKLLYLECISRDVGCVSFDTFTTNQQVEKMWNCRNGIRLALMEKNPQFAVISAEVGVPLSCVTTFMREVKRFHSTYNVSMPNHGHAGDGNFHAWVVYDTSNRESRNRATKIHDELVMCALRMGGTVTGEHGIGMSKKHFLKQEHPTSMQLMQDIKHLLDPKGILNPGKIFPD